MELCFYGKYIQSSILGCQNTFPSQAWQLPQLQVNVGGPGGGVGMQIAVLALYCYITNYPPFTSTKQ